MERLRMNPEVFKAPDGLPDQNLWMAEAGCDTVHASQAELN